VSRRASLPGADELFRGSRRPRSDGVRAVRAVDVEEAPGDRADDDDDRRGSGRVRHDEKITVYVTADELIELEHARLALRRRHGLAVDRGRLVREAVAVVLADLEARGDASVLVERLRG
jgi:hypothetical protein